jgi:hypothetical protein
MPDAQEDQVGRDAQILDEGLARRLAQGRTAVLDATRNGYGGTFTYGFPLPNGTWRITYTLRQETGGEAIYDVSIEQTSGNREDLALAVSLVTRDALYENVVTTGSTVTATMRAATGGQTP